MQKAELSSNWFFPVKKKCNTTIQLICFPFAGGGASAFGAWQKFLNPEIQLLPVQLPGRENRFSEPAINSFEQLLTKLTSLIQPYTENQWAVFGHSMGALLATEVTAKLVEAGCNPPVHIFVSGKTPIHLPPQKPQIGFLDDESLLLELQYRYGVEQSIDQQKLMKIMLNTIRADIQVVESHHRSYPVRIPSPLTAIFGNDDNSVAEEEMMLWAEFTAGEFDLVKIPGNHFYLQSSCSELTTCLNQHLSR